MGVRAVAGKGRKGDDRGGTVSPGRGGRGRGMAGACSLRSDRSGGVLPREGWLHQRGQEGLSHLRRARRLPRVRVDERRALRDLGRAVGARASQAQETRRLTLGRGGNRGAERAAPSVTRLTPPRMRRPPGPTLGGLTVYPTVVALLVSHDGSRWLPAVIDGLRSQTVPLSGVVCVDTGSRDESPDLLLDAFDEVVTVSGRTAYPEAVRIGLEQVPADAAEWIWLLHDDSNPAPDALERLLEAAAADPAADVLGPKVREWPSLKRLLEVGVTISGTGRRETGLETGEYDQGQHDDVREVLAVNTAGMLVRRSVYDRLRGLDDTLPMFGNDVDFGWRAASAGVRTVVVPQAVVFHAEAAHRGVRRTPLTGRHTHYQERRAALFTLLANAPARSLPWRTVRLFFGTLVRMIGFLGVRSAGEALDDLAALFSVYSSPGEIRRARKARRTDGAHDPTPLLAPWWLPYRHGLDFLGDIAAAATNQAQDVADRRRAAKDAAAPAPLRRPVAADDDDSVAEDTGLVARFFSNPLAVALGLVVVLSIVGVREAFGLVTGGGLAPAPADAQAW